VEDYETHLIESASLLIAVSRRTICAITVITGSPELRRVRSILCSTDETQLPPPGRFDGAETVGDLFDFMVGIVFSYSVKRH